MQRLGGGVGGFGRGWWGMVMVFGGFGGGLCGVRGSGSSYDGV